MSPKPSSEQDPIQAELEAALADSSLLDIDETTGRIDKGGSKERQEGDLVKGTVVGVSSDDIIVELGPRQQGVLAPSEFDKPPTVGEIYEFSMHGQKDGLWLLSRRKAKALAAWSEIQQGSRVQAEVTAVNSGGLEVKVGPLNGFMPASQASGSRVDDLSTLVGQRLECIVTEMDKGKKRFVVSHRRVIEADRAEKQAEMAGSMGVGTEVSGRITRIEAFGAFVDLGGMEGLVHVSQISRARVNHPNDVLKQGQDVRCLIVKIEEGGKRIGLSMKAFEPDPWEGISMKYPPDTIVQGKVVRIADFGAFVEIEPGVDGLVHISQISSDHNRINRVGDVLKSGQELAVRVLTVDPSQNRISLSMLDERGAKIGSEDAVDAADLRGVIEETKGKDLGTNLGSLFKKALDKK